MKSISPARMVAARTLWILENESFTQSNEVLHRLSSQNALKKDDLRLARSLVFGVLRHGITLDYYFTPFLKKPPASLDTRFRLCLRLAAYQTLMLDRLPDYAIVNETVELARQVFKMKDQQTGFLNAVLRKLIAKAEHPPLPTGNRVHELAVRYSFPQPLAGALVKRFGTHKAVTLMEACNQEAPLALRVNTLKTTVAALAQSMTSRDFPVTPGNLAPESLVVGSHPAGHSIFDLPEFHEGHFYVQDEASQLVAHLLAPAPGENILDMCSAPGGKTTHLTELATGAAHFTATDYSSERLKLVQENIDRLQSPGIQVQTLDRVLQEARTYDAVLVDAPCSGAGTIRRNPEIRYRFTDDNLKHHSERQLKVLEQAAPLVRPGGRLIYSTCSFSEQENRDVIRHFLKEHPEWSAHLSPVNTIVAPLFHEDGFYRTWPDFPGLDGFEAVVLQKLN